MSRKLFLAAACAAALAAAGCGSSSSSSEAPPVGANEARTAVEQATGVKLAKTDIIPADAGREAGVLGSFANIDTVVSDKQVVMLLVLDEASKIDEIKDEISAGIPGEAEAVEHENALVVYASQGKDRSSDIKTALAGL